MEELYGNIGGKIKTLAKVIFVIEAIGAVISGFAFWGSGRLEAFFTGLLVMLVGPVVAFVSSWILYAFGELVEKTADNEENTRAIARMMHNEAMARAAATGAAPSAPAYTYASAGKPPVSSAPISSYEAGFWICRKCNSKNAAASRYCKNCGEYK